MSDASPSRSPRHGRRADPLRAALASGAIPGFGQLLQGRRRAALIAVAPLAVAIAALTATILRGGPVAVASALAGPGRLAALVTLLILFAIWRIGVVLDAGRGAERSRRNAALLTLALVLAVGPELGAAAIVDRARNTSDNIFSGFGDGGDGASNSGEPSGSPVEIGDRFTMLLVGADAMGSRTSFNTDSMIIASWDRVGGWVSTISIPRDIVNVPLGNGDVWEPKINSLWSTATRRPDLFPNGGATTLAGALGTMLGVKIDATAVIVIPTFRKLVDDIGGVDIRVKREIFDPRYRERGLRGVRLPKGYWHLDGECALAYARVRKAAGTDDFNRGGRQQELLVAIKERLAGSGNLLSNGLALLSALGDGVRTDLDQALLPTLADGASTLDTTHIISAQMRAGDGILRYRRKGEVSPYGSVVFFDPAAMSLLGSRLFPTPGTQPYGWPRKAGDPPFTATPASPAVSPTSSPPVSPSVSPSASLKPSPSANPSASASGAPSPTATATASPVPRPYPTLSSCNANVAAPVYTPEPDQTDMPPPSESALPTESTSPETTATPSASTSPPTSP